MQSKLYGPGMLSSPAWIVAHNNSLNVEFSRISTDIHTLVNSFFFSPFMDLHLDLIRNKAFRKGIESVK